MVLDHGDIGIYIINNREILLEDLVRKVGYEHGNIGTERPNEIQLLQTTF
jgi:hypothetical protein